MTISQNDIFLWEKFKETCKKIKNTAQHVDIEKIAKKNIKTKENFKNYKQNIKNTFLSSNTGNFLLKKDLTLGIDKNSDKKLKKGEFKIDYKLDLHGFTIDKAYNALVELFKHAELNNFKCLLIITGKGLHSKDKTIKTSIIEWFSEPFFANKIIKYTDANKKDGGSGALYVLLRNK